MPENLTISVALKNQLSNPSHVYIKLSTGDLVSEWELIDGRFKWNRLGPVRFTLLAARSIVNAKDPHYKGAQLIPCHSLNGKSL